MKRPTTTRTKRRKSAEHRSLLWAAVVAMTVGVAALGCFGGPDSPAAPERLRVLYAGDAGTAHAESFQKFLSQHFEVRSIDLDELTEANTDAIDVLVLDGEVLDYSGERMRVRPAPTGITLDTLSLPTVLIGGRAAQVADQLHLKLGWKYG